MSRKQRKGGGATQHPHPDKPSPNTPDTEGDVLEVADLMPPPEILDRLVRMRKEGRLPSLEEVRDALKGTVLEPPEKGETDS